MSGINDPHILLWIQPQFFERHLGIAVGAGSRRTAADSLAAQLFDAPNRWMAVEKKLVGSEARHYGESLFLPRDGAYNRFGISPKYIDLAGLKFRHSLRAGADQKHPQLDTLLGKNSLIDA